MNFLATPQGNEILVAPEGRLDVGNAMALEPELLRLAETYTVFRLDFAGIPYISSAGIRTLLTLYRAVAPRGGSVTLLNANDQVREILHETEFDDLFGL